MQCLWLVVFVGLGAGLIRFEYFWYGFSLGFFQDFGLILGRWLLWILGSFAAFKRLFRPGEVAFENEVFRLWLVSHLEILGALG